MTTPTETAFVPVFDVKEKKSQVAELENFNSRIHHINEQGVVSIWFDTALYDQNRGVKL